MPSVFICAPLDQTDALYKAQLSRELEARGIKIVSTLAHCQWAIFIQTPEAVKSAQVQMILATAMKLKQQQHLRGVLRFIYNPIQRSYSAWDALPGFDATQNIDEVLKQLLQTMNGPSSRESTTSSFEFTRGNLQASGSSINNLLFPPSSGPLHQQAPSSSNSGPLHQQAPSFNAPPSLPPEIRHRSPVPQAITERATIKPSDWEKKLFPPGRSTKSPLDSIPIGWLIAGVSITILLLIISLSATQPLSFFTSLQHAAPPTQQDVGRAYLLSTGANNFNNLNGINDIIQLDLTHLVMPAANKRYYAWLLPDLKEIEGSAIPLGIVTVDNGASHLRYADPTHSNLLKITSRLLITEEDASTTPVVPSSNQADWRYYAEIPQQADKGNMMSMGASYLDHLRHLLVGQPDLEKLSLHGGLVVWLLQNTRQEVEWAASISSARDLQNPPFMRQDLVSILDYLDGLPYVQQDVPQGTTPQVDKRVGQIGLLTLNPNAMPPGYLQHVAVHLDAMVHSPGATNSDRQIEQQITTYLTEAKGDLEQAREDARQLLASPNDFSSNAASLNLLHDLVNRINDAYTGNMETQMGGILWIYNQIQHFATFEVRSYRPM